MSVSWWRAGSGIAAPGEEAILSYCEREKESIMMRSMAAGAENIAREPLVLQLHREIS